MIIFPAIDIKDGRCVRLTQGDYNKVEIFSEDPVETALKWQSQGGQYLHVVDLDGALAGKPVNKKLISDIVAALDIPVQAGGGIRDMNYAEEMLSAGVSRVILGTGALADRDFIRNILKKYGEKTAVSIDAKNGLVAVKGWTEISDVKAVDFAQELEDYGLKTIVYTDISRDGMMSGPNFQELQNLKSSVKADIIASGGITAASDIETLKKMDLYGAIIGKALYTGSITLSEVL